MFNTIRDMHPDLIIMVISELGKQIWIGIKTSLPQPFRRRE
jgi:hypothetical protein